MSKPPAAADDASPPRARVAYVIYVISAYKYPAAARTAAAPAVDTDRRLLDSRRAENAAGRLPLDGRAEADGIPNVHFLPRHGSHWAGFGHVRATLKGLADVLERRVPFDYVVLLTAQDYPCAPRLTSSVTSPPPAVARSCEAVRPKVRCVCRRVDPRCAAAERARFKRLLLPVSQHGSNGPAFVRLRPSPSVVDKGGHPLYNELASSEERTPDGGP